MWEYLLFAGDLLRGVVSLETKYRDHQLRYATRTGEVISAEGFADYASHATSDALRLIEPLERLTEPRVQEAAFGPSGVEGDAALIEHLALRWTSIYEGLMDWAARHRGLSSPTEFHDALDLLAQMVDEPVEQYRVFVYDLVGKIDRVPAALAAGGDEPIHVSCTLTLTIAPEVTDAFARELARLARTL